MPQLNDATVAKLVETLAAINASSQDSTQTAKQINQSISDLLSKMSAQATSQATQVLQEETFGAERIQSSGVSQTEAWAANAKRTYDEYQQESLESIKRNRSYVDKVLSDALQFDNQRQVIANQALQNAVETSNMVGKQAVRHGDIAIDAQWNPVQQGAADTLLARGVSIDDASLKAIGAVVAVAVSEALSKKS